LFDELDRIDLAGIDRLSGSDARVDAFGVSLGRLRRIEE